MLTFNVSLLKKQEPLPELDQNFQSLNPKFMVWNKNQDLGISTLVHPDFYHQRWFLVKIYDPLVFKQKTVFSKNRGEATFSRYSHKTQKLEGCEPHSILPKPQNRKKATPRRYLQNLKKKNRGDTTFQLISTTQISKQKTKVRKNLKFQKSWGGDIPSIPTKPNFWEKSKEATFSRYLHPNPRGSDIPSILATEWARKRHSIDTCNTI